MSKIPVCSNCGVYLRFIRNYGNVINGERKTSNVELCGKCYLESKRLYRLAKGLK